MQRRVCNIRREPAVNWGARAVPLTTVWVAGEGDPRGAVTFHPCSSRPPRQSDSDNEERPGAYVKNDRAREVPVRTRAKYGVAAWRGQSACLRVRLSDVLGHL